MRISSPYRMRRSASIVPVRGAGERRVVAPPCLSPGSVDELRTAAAFAAVHGVTSNEHDVVCLAAGASAGTFGGGVGVSDRAEVLA